jgi:hypothetical protein
MESIEQKTEAEAAAEAAAAGGAGAGGKKGKKGGKGGASASATATATAAAAAAADKKRKRSADGLSPTQELLPLIQGELRDYQLRGKRERERVERSKSAFLVTQTAFLGFSTPFRASLPRPTTTILSP